MAIEVPDWYRTVALVGVDITGEPVVVLLDSTGAIISVMKGEYAGTLKNVQVDSQGRILMIPTDPADIWGNAISMGNAELAARLGTIQRFDNRGQTLFVDSFENGDAHYSTTLVGTGAAVAITTAETRFGGFALKMTGGSTANRSAQAKWEIPYGALSRSGLEVGVRFGDNVEGIVVEMNLFDGTYSYIAGVYFEAATGKWYYYSSAGTWVDSGATMLESVSEGSFYAIKLVADFPNNKYSRLLFSKQEVDLSAFAMMKSLDASAPSLRCIVEVYSDAATNGWIYVDPLVVTQNEPA